MPLCRNEITPRIIQSSNGWPGGIRPNFPIRTLADLYDPLTMLREPVKAHNAPARIVDLACRPAVFPNDRARTEFLFSLLAAPLPAALSAKLKKPPKVFYTTRRDRDEKRSD